MHRNHSSTFAGDFLTLLPCSHLRSTFKRQGVCQLRASPSPAHPLCSISFPWTARVARSQQLRQFGRNCQNSTISSRCHSRRKCFDLSPPALEGKEEKGRNCLYCLPGMSISYNLCLLQTGAFLPPASMRAAGSQPQLCYAHTREHELPAGTAARLRNEERQGWLNCHNPLWTLWPWNAGRSRKGAPTKLKPGSVIKKHISRNQTKKGKWLYKADALFGYNPHASKQTHLFWF